MNALKRAAPWMILAGLFGAGGVGAGAYGWHTLGQDGPIREIFMMGVGYQMWHALALLGVAWLAARPETATMKAPIVAGLAFSVGIVLFSGTLYAFALWGGVPVEGAAPAGGYALMLGWAAFVWIGIKVLRVKG